MLVRTCKDKNNPYVLINKHFLEDQTISLKAKGLLAYCMSKPTDWKFNIYHLTGDLKEGRDAVYSGFKELIDAGYCVRAQNREDKGHFGKSDYILYESPQYTDQNHAGNPYTGNPYTDNPEAGLSDAVPYILVKNELSNIDISLSSKERGPPPTAPPTSPIILPPLKPKKKQVCKTQFRENISLTQEQHETLLKSYGQSKLDWMLDHLAAKKGAHGYKYKSDYHVLLPSNWVNQSYLEHCRKNKIINNSVVETADSQAHKTLCEAIEQRLLSRIGVHIFFQAGPTKAFLCHTPKDFKREYIYGELDKEQLLKDLEICFPGTRETLFGKPTKSINLLTPLTSKLTTANLRG